MQNFYFLNNGLEIFVSANNFSATEGQCFLENIRLICHGNYDVSSGITSRKKLWNTRYFYKILLIWIKLPCCFNSMSIELIQRSLQKVLHLKWSKWLTKESILPSLLFFAVECAGWDLPSFSKVKVYESVNSEDNN